MGGIKCTATTSCSDVSISMSISIVLEFEPNMGVAIYSLDWTTGLDHWTGLLDWATGLTFDPKNRAYKALFNPQVGSVYSLDWTTGPDYWTGILDSPLTSKIVYTRLNLVASYMCQLKSVLINAVLYQN